MDTNKFVNRHVGISAEDIPSMLQAIGVKSVDELIDQTIPSDIRLKEPLYLPDPMTEREFAEHIAELLNDGTSADDIYAKLTARNKNGELYQYRVVAQNVEKPVADAIIEYSKSYRTAPEKEGETGYRIAVLSTEQSTTRSYPYGAFASSVIGFCNNDENGKLVAKTALKQCKYASRTWSKAKK